MFGKVLMAALTTLVSINVATPGINAYSETQTYASISESNVATDLKLLFGGDNPNEFDLNSLVPTSEDYDSTFKFLAMYPYGKDLYLYLYDYESHNYNFYSYSYFYVSMSTDEIDSVDDLEEGQVTQYHEDIEKMTASFVNSYGYQGRFVKYKLEGVLNPLLQQRVYIDTAVIEYVDSYGVPVDFGNHEVVNEILIDDTGVDLVYEYYKEDYVLIDNAALACLLTPSEDKTRAKSSWNGNSFFGEYYEDFYYFFTEDPTHPIDELVEVRYDYTLVSYDAYTTNKGNQLTEKREVCYDGLIDGSSVTVIEDESSDDIGFWGYVAMIANPNLGFAYLGDTVSKNSRVDTWDQSIVTGVEMMSATRLNTPIVRDAETTKWAWRTKEKTYQIDTIIDLNDEEAYTDDIYWNQNDFTNAVNVDGQYDWAFLVDTSMRECTSWEHTKGWWIFGNTYEGVSSCHEVVDAMVTYLRYYTDGIEFSLDALSTPVSTAFIGTSSETMSTLHDQLITVFSSINSGTNTVLKWVGIALAILAGIAIVGLIIWLCVRHHNNKKNKTIVNVNTSSGYSYKNNNSKNNCSKAKSNSSKNKTYNSKNYYNKTYSKDETKKKNKDS